MRISVVFYDLFQNIMVRCCVDKYFPGDVGKARVQRQLRGEFRTVHCCTVCCTDTGRIPTTPKTTRNWQFSTDSAMCDVMVYQEIPSVIATTCCHLKPIIWKLLNVLLPLLTFTIYEKSILFKWKIQKSTDGTSYLFIISTSVLQLLSSQVICIDKYLPASSCT